MYNDCRGDLMRFLISPAKTLNLSKNSTWNEQQPQFYDKSLILRKHILKLSKNQMSKRFKIKSKLLEKTYDGYHSSTEKGHALMSFNGLVYKNLDVWSLTKDPQAYLKRHVLILDAMYGILRPNDIIEYYRLDFNVNIGKDLYKYWNILSFFEDEIIVSLASKEYEKMIEGLPYITVDFKEKVGDSYINKATYAKMARGKFLRNCAKNGVSTLIQLKEMTFDGYQFNETLSSDQHYIYTRKSV
jgi:cytoplasmic iron level regulating protein YaaA (DUF328/UPF0246 family)